MLNQQLTSWATPGASYSSVPTRKQESKGSSQQSKSVSLSIDEEMMSSTKRVKYSLAKQYLITLLIGIQKL